MSGRQPTQGVAKKRTMVPRTWKTHPYAAPFLLHPHLQLRRAAGQETIKNMERGSSSGSRLHETKNLLFACRPPDSRATVQRVRPKGSGRRNNKISANKGKLEERASNSLPLVKKVSWCCRPSGGGLVSHAGTRRGKKGNRGFTAKNGGGTVSVGRSKGEDVFLQPNLKKFPIR